MVEELRQTRQNIEAKEKGCQTAELLTEILETVLSFCFYILCATRHHCQTEGCIDVFSGSKVSAYVIGSWLFVA